MFPSSSACRPTRRFHGLAAAALALGVGACGAPEPLEVGVEQAALVAPGSVEGWGAMLRVRLRLDNRGDAPVHVFTDLLQVVGEAGGRGTVRGFRDGYRLNLARSGHEQRRRLEAALAGVGIAGDDVRRIGGPQIEIPAGQSIEITLPFLLGEGRPDDRYAMDFSYHDDANDRITRLSLRVRAR